MFGNYLLNVHIYSLKLHLLFFHNVSVVYEAELYYLNTCYHNL